MIRGPMEYVVFRGDSLFGIWAPLAYCAEIIKKLDILNLKEGVDGIGKRSITIWYRTPWGEDRIRFLED